MASFLVRGSTLRGGESLRGDAQLDFSFEASGGITFSGAAEVAVEVEFVASGGIVFSGAARLSGPMTSLPGATGMLVQTPAFVEPEGLSGPLPVFEWRTSRYQNRIGTWEASIPIDDGMIDGEPLHKQIRRGWHVSLLQENNGPNIFGEWYRLYLGVVLERSYDIAEGGTVRLKLSGTFRDQHLADRSTFDGLSYNETPDGIIDDLLDGDNIIGPNDGASYPSNFATTNLNITFHDISRYAAMIKVAELRRVALRESWRYDVPEFVRIDGPPDAHVIITNVESDAENLSIAARKGFALIAAPPLVKFRGQDIVNRIIPVGSDTPDGDLTLQYSNVTTPYTPLSAPTPGGGTYFYIEDEESIARYGLVEQPLIRTDVKNPSDNSATRQASANVLYAVAVGELLRRKSEAMIVEVDLANGANIWALPGDAVRLQYTGIAQAENGSFTWLDEDRYFIVTERHDESTPSGIRNVRLVIAAPEIIMEIPDLPNEVPGTTPTNEEPGDTDPSLDPNEPTDPEIDPEVPGPGGEVPEILPPIDTSPIPPGIIDPLGPSCCDDPDVDIEEGPEQPPIIIEHGDPILNLDALPESNGYLGFGADTYPGNGFAGDIYLEMYYTIDGGVNPPVFKGWHIFVSDGSPVTGSGDASWRMSTTRISPNGGDGTVEVHLETKPSSNFVLTGYVGVTQVGGSILWHPGTPVGAIARGTFLFREDDPPMDVSP